MKPKKFFDHQPMERDKFPNAIPRHGVKQKVCYFKRILDEKQREEQEEKNWKKNIQLKLEKQRNGKRTNMEDENKREEIGVQKAEQQMYMKNLEETIVRKVEGRTKVALEEFEKQRKEEQCWMKHQIMMLIERVNLLERKIRDKERIKEQQEHKHKENATNAQQKMEEQKSKVCDEQARIEQQRLGEKRKKDREERARIEQQRDKEQRGKECDEQARMDQQEKQRRKEHKEQARMEQQRLEEQRRKDRELAKNEQQSREEQINQREKRIAMIALWNEKVPETERKRKQDEKLKLRRRNSWNGFDNMPLELFTEPDEAIGDVDDKSSEEEDDQDFRPNKSGKSSFSGLRGAYRKVMKKLRLKSKSKVKKAKSEPAIPSSARTKELQADVKHNVSDDDLWFKEFFLQPNSLVVKDEISQKLESFQGLTGAYGITGPSAKIPYGHLFVTVKRSFARQKVLDDLKEAFGERSVKYIELLRQKKKPPKFSFLSAADSGQGNISKHGQNKQLNEVKPSGGISREDSNFDPNPLVVHEQEEFLSQVTQNQPSGTLMLLATSKLRMK